MIDSRCARVLGVICVSVCALRLFHPVATTAQVSATNSSQEGRGAGRGQLPDTSSAIVGRVVTPGGLPVPDVFVTVLTSGPVGPSPFGRNMRLIATSNQHGEFRVDGLRPGEYYVLALPHNPVFDATGRGATSGHGNAFYPDALRFADAKTVRVTGNVLAPIEITVSPVRVSRISGVVTASTGERVRGGLVMLTHGDGLFGLDSRAVRIRPDGTFVAPALQPGTYILQYREGVWPPPRDVIPTVSGATVAVRETDVTDVQVKPIQMVVVRGRVRLGEGFALPDALSSIQIGASSVGLDCCPGPQRPASLNPDLTFEFRTWPYPGVIRLLLANEPGRPPSELAIEAVRLNGVDVRGKPIDFIEGRVVSGLEIEIGRSEPNLNRRGR